MKPRASNVVILVMFIITIGFFVYLLVCSYYPLNEKPENNKTIPVRLVFAGDVLLSRNIGDIIARESPEFPFEHVYDILHEGDVTMGNLESPLSDLNDTRCDKDAHYCFRATPESVHGLVYAGFDIMTLANNHALDYGPAVLNDTMVRLSSSGIRYCGVNQGTGDIIQDAVIISDPRLKVAYLCFNDIWFYDNTTGYTVNGYPGNVYPRQWNASEDEVIPAVKRARSLADIVVVNFHFGEEYNVTHSERQELLSHAAADAGADIIVGHHPHVIQDLEIYNRSIIAYSLGNFIFDAKGTGSREGGVLTVQIDPKSKQIAGYSFDRVYANPEFQPRPGLAGMVISYYERAISWFFSKIYSISRKSFG
jgi:poly-gamma-glutamate synthesis protein (capsule biosynthesis protein)